PRRGLLLLRDLLRDLLLLLLHLSFLLCSWLLAALLCLLATAAVACGAALALLRGCCEGTEGLSGLSRLWGPAQRAWGAGLHCGQALGVGTWLLMDPGKVCLAATRSLFRPLAALRDSLAGSVLRVRELLAAFLALAATRATAVSIRLWLRCQLAVKLLCSATVVFISVYFLAVVCHSGARSLGAPFVTLWDSLTSLIFGVTDLLAAFLAHVSGAAIAVSMLLWWLCQMAFEFLCSISKVFTSIFFVGVYILGLLLRIVFLIVLVAVIYCNQEVLWMLKGHVLGSTRRLQPVLRRLYQVAMLTLRRATASQPWHRLVDWVLTNWSQAGRRMNQGREQLDAGQAPQPRPVVSCAGAGQHLRTPRGELGTPGGRAVSRQQLNATAGSAEGTSGNNPWVLLKEQDEQKKCVICQDQTKTVLLLPCRHLCLCQECTEVLLQQDIYQRNCPLCRQMILQTLNVYL
ncbi:RNF26 ligase, partial [Hirundo rustica]|nr:RNF26 ligase [Hirundo rustica]